MQNRFNVRIDFNDDRLENDAVTIYGTKNKVEAFIAFFGDFAFTADSDGKEFVFSYMNIEFLTKSLVTSVIVMPLYNDSICTFKYTQKSDNKIVTIVKTAVYNKNNEFGFLAEEVYLQTTFPKTPFGPVATSDFRIFGSCTEDVKMIGRIMDPINAWGDHFVIPSITNAEKDYIFSVPKQSYYLKGFITILPIGQEDSLSVNVVGYVDGQKYSDNTIQYNTAIGNEQHYISIWFDYNVDDEAKDSLSVNVVGYVDGEKYSDNTIKYNTAIGKEQHYISIWFDYNVDDEASIVISASSPIALSFATPWSIDDTDQDKPCYIAFMLMPVVQQNCYHNLINPDQRIITNVFTSIVYISPPAVDANCNEEFLLNVFNEKDNMKGSIKTISKTIPNHINLDGEISEIATTTVNGQIPMYRIGASPRIPGIDTQGHFAHYIPSTQEWINGKTPFYILGTDCSLEIYTTDINPDSIQIDEVIGTKYGLNLQKNNYFGHEYGYYITSIKNYGLHTIESNSSYTAFVICKRINSIADIAGYLIGFNKRKAL
uniref:IgGFc_binding domain-containing protein n=1 Tax=Rhabditophanes sp. KR3021 TaxID=114890 RepID=A0AC35UDM0_9BILA